MSQYKVEITSLAAEEFIAAFQYYENQQLGLGNRFAEEINTIISQLKVNPFIFLY
jgi:hypothetical protein